MLIEYKNMNKFVKENKRKKLFKIEKFRKKIMLLKFLSGNSNMKRLCRL